MDERPLLLIDIDGVLNVFGVGACPDGYFEHDVFPDDDEPMRLSSVHADWLRELSTVFDFVWASAWGFEAHERLGAILRLDRFPFVPMPAIPFPPHEKVPAIAEYVGDRAVAWVDDAILPEAISWAESRVAPTLLVPTDHTRGLQRAHVDQLLEWADTVAGSTPEPATRRPAASVHLPTALVARYRAVDREIVGSGLVDTPSHLDALASDVAAHGIVIPLRLGFNEAFGTLDGNHRIAVAIRLGLESVPVALAREPLTPQPAHARPMLRADYIVLRDAEART